MTVTRNKQELHRDRIARIYHGSESDSETQRRARNRVDWMISQAHGHDVLDIGCSEGIAAILLVRLGYAVRGVDLHPDVIGYATELADEMLKDRQERPTFEVADVLDWEEPQAQYDTVFLGEVVEHVFEPERMIALAAASLRPGGSLVLTTPWGFFPAPDHHQTLFLTDVIAIMPAELGITSLDVIDGYIRLVAKKGAPAGNGTGSLSTNEILNLTERAALASQQFLRGLFDMQTERLNSSWVTINELKRNRDSLNQEHREVRKALNEAREAAKAATEEATGNARLRKMAVTELEMANDSVHAARAELTQALASNEREKAAKYRLEGATAELRRLLSASQGQAGRSGARRWSPQTKRQAAVLSRAALGLYNVPVTRSLVTTFVPKGARRKATRRLRQLAGSGAR